MHGEYRHLKEHERIAKQSGIQTLLVENGDVAQISNSSNAAVIDKVDSGRIFLDGSVLIDEQEGVISERKKLMYNGLLNVSILVNEIKPYFNFEMDLIGISTTVDFKKEILIHLENELNYSLGNNKTKKLQNIESYYLESEVRRILNKFLKSEIGKKPHISICIHRMDII
jgi:ribonuclease J